ncbi:MAG: GNAT family N-acetyltransferase [Chloroflexi bacterium]|nr:MAG: GNAT family N-acetyltransferase [Chloroflexota bacterium]
MAQRSCEFSIPTPGGSAIVRLASRSAGSRVDLARRSPFGRGFVTSAVATPPPTRRLAFREMTLADIDDLALLLGDPDVLWVYPHPYTRDEARGWIEWNVGLYRELGFGLWYLTLRDTGEFVGECGLTPQQVEGATEIEVGYHVRPKFWGLGFATEAARACRSFAREVAGLHRLVALIDPRNVASQRVAAKIGLAFEREASVPGKVLRVYSSDL